MKSTEPLSLFIVLLGSKAPGRNVEQHDYFFGIAHNVKELAPAMKAFWPESGKSIHIDGYRRVGKVGDYRVTVVERTGNEASEDVNKLFFINLGGYQSGKLEEQHYTVLSVHEDRMHAMKESKKTLFFKSNTLKGAAGAHIDEKYGIDVDDVYRIEEVLAPVYKDKYHLQISPASEDAEEDEIWLGYLTFEKLSAGG